MHRVIPLANQIGEIYTSSEEYKRYMALYEKLKTDEELMQTLVQYRSSKVRNYVNFTSKGEEDKDAEQQVTDLYQKLFENSDMNEMLILEDDLMRNLTQIYKAIGEKCVLNIEIEQ